MRSLCSVLVQGLRQGSTFVLGTVSALVFQLSGLVGGEHGAKGSETGRPGGSLGSGESAGEWRRGPTDSLPRHSVL